MAKVINIVGASRPVVVETCGECPLCVGLWSCKHPDGARVCPVASRIADRCPLPDQA